jgi:hypothetical protein
MSGFFGTATMDRVNYSLIAIQLGNTLEDRIPMLEIDRIADAFFDFESRVHVNESITSETAQCVYDWVMTLSEQDMSDAKKRALLNAFITALTSP